MIDQKKVRELAEKYIAYTTADVELVKLIGKVVMGVMMEYYGYDSVDEVYADDDSLVGDGELTVIMDEVRECLNKALREALS